MAPGRASFTRMYPHRVPNMRDRQEDMGSKILRHLGGLQSGTRGFLYPPAIVVAQTN